METIPVWLGRHWTNEKILHFMVEGEVSYFEVEEDGCFVLVPEFRSEVESWLSRTDMCWQRLHLPTEEFEAIMKSFDEYHLYSWQQGKIEETEDQLRNDFLSLLPL